MKRKKGVSLMEYALIAGTITLAALPALVGLCHELSNSVSSMIPVHRKGLAPAIVMSANTPAGNLQAIKPSPATRPVSTQPNAPLVLSTTELTETVQTAGVNGTTALLSDSLIALSNKLRQEGSIDESTYNTIAALANQGHTLARIEASVEIAAKAAGNGGGSAFNRTKAVLDGKSYSGPDLVTMLNSTSPDIIAFQKLQSQVLKDTSLKNPDLNSVISQLSNNILNLANASATSGDWISGDGSAINTYESFISDIPDMIDDYSRKTTKNSNDICSTQRNTAICTQ